MCLGTAIWLIEAPARAEIAVEDDLGRVVRLEAPARRIIALYGAFNEMLAGMGLEDRIVARTKTDRFPPSIVDKPSIGTHMRPNTELVVGLKPDLVLQMAGRKEAADAVEALEQFGIKTAVFKAETFQELYSIIKRLGILTAGEKQAENLIQTLNGRLDRIANLVGSRSTRPRVFFEVRYPNLLAAGRSSIVNDIIEKAGGENCVDSPKKLVRLSEERLLELSPEVYIVQKGPMNPSPIPPGERAHYQALQAVRQGQVHIVDEQEFSRPGPRNVEAVEALAGFLHPNLFDSGEKQ